MSEGEPQHEVTRLIQAAGASDRAAADQLLTLIYDQLRKIAQQRMADERRDHTLQATALVHEAYLKLVGDQKVRWSGRAHFFAATAEAMRQLLIDHARARKSQKRGGEGQRVPLSDFAAALEADSADVFALDEALSRLETEDAEAARAVKLRFFAGLSVDETADSLGVSPRKADMLCARARAWLFRALEK